MGHLSILTTLATEPRRDCVCNRNFKTIVKGATAILSYSLSNGQYLVDYDSDGNLDFRQFTLALRQPSGFEWTYEYYAEDGSIDSHFSYDELTKTIDFTLTGEETGELQDADIDAPMEWEIAIETRDGSTIVEEQRPIVVLDSIYNRTKGHGVATPYASERTLCSSSLICNN